MTKRSWLDVAEAGFTLGMEFFVLLSTVMGRSAARMALPFVAVYYTLFNGVARHASRLWLARILGRDHVPLSSVFRHFLTYSQITLDRLFFVRRQTSGLRILRKGTTLLEEASRRRTGGILLSAHLGSFEALRAQASEDDLTVNIVGFFRNARMINSILRRFDPEGTTRLIEVDPSSVDFIFQVQECVGRGEFVGILGDRIGLGGQTAEVDLLGGRSRLPAGAFLLASALGCPVYLTFALYRGPSTYEIHCELFEDRIIIPREDRQAAVQHYVQKYADSLARYARMAPYNWSNFFVF